MNNNNNNNNNIKDELLESLLAENAGRRKVSAPCVVKNGYLNKQARQLLAQHVSNTDVLSRCFKNASEEFLRYLEESYGIESLMER